MGTMIPPEALPGSLANMIARGSGGKERLLSTWELQRVYPRNATITYGKPQKVPGGGWWLPGCLILSTLRLSHLPAADRNWRGMPKSYDLEAVVDWKVMLKDVTFVKTGGGGNLDFISVSYAGERESGTAVFIGGNMKDQVKQAMVQINQAVSAVRASPLPPFQAQAPAQTVVEREIIKEIVKIPCKYCGTLVPVTDPKCESCGAPLSR